MNKQDKIDFILAHPDKFNSLSFTHHNYGGINTASFNKVLWNGKLQFTGWTGNSNGYWNLNLVEQEEDRVTELYNKMKYSLEKG